MNLKTFLSLGTMSAAGSGPCGGRLEAGQKPAGALESRHAWKSSFPGGCAKPRGGQGQVCWLPAIAKASTKRSQGLRGPKAFLLCAGVSGTPTLLQRAWLWPGERGTLTLSGHSQFQPLPGAGWRGTSHSQRLPSPRLRGSVKSGSPVQELPVVRQQEQVTASRSQKKPMRPQMGWATCSWCPRLPVSGAGC